jgi:hypothetical protein
VFKGSDRYVFVGGWHGYVEDNIGIGRFQRGGKVRPEESAFKGELPATVPGGVLIEIN